MLCTCIDNEHLAQWMRSSRHQVLPGNLIRFMEYGRMNVHYSLVFLLGTSHITMPHPTSLATYQGPDALPVLVQSLINLYTVLRVFRFLSLITKEKKKG
jgi:hypothetical protein